MGIKEIKRFQTDRELHTKIFDVINENANILEELLEAQGLDVAKDNRPLLKAEWVEFVSRLQEVNIAVNAEECGVAYTVDAYADIVVFAVGAMMKLGYEPNHVLEEVAKEINSRVGTMVDGKFEKDLTAVTYKANYTK